MGQIQTSDRRLFDSAQNLNAAGGRGAKVVINIINRKSTSFSIVNCTFCYLELT